MNDGSVVSIDPLYQFSKKEIMQRIDEVAEEVMSQVKAHEDCFCLEEYPRSRYTA